MAKKTKVIRRVVYIIDNGKITGRLRPHKIVLEDSVGGHLMDGRPVRKLMNWFVTGNPQSARGIWVYNVSLKLGKVL